MCGRWNKSSDKKQYNGNSVLLNIIIINRDRWILLISSCIRLFLHMGRLTAICPIFHDTMWTHFLWHCHNHFGFILFCPCSHDTIWTHFLWHCHDHFRLTLFCPFYHDTVWTYFLWQYPDHFGLALFLPFSHDTIWFDLK